MLTNLINCILFIMKKVLTNFIYEGYIGSLNTSIGSMMDF